MKPVVKPTPKPTFFKTPDHFRAWLEQHHANRSELLVGFYKVGSGKRSITWPESVDEALAFGWIDGIRRGIDAVSYSIRFTPRKPTSIWSAVNIKRVAELTAAGRMSAAGLAAFARRDAKRSAIYSYERANAAFDEAALAAIHADATAWAHYQREPPYYRHLVAHWVTSAKKPETRARRLQTLIDCCRRGQRIPSQAPRESAKAQDKMKAK